MAGSVALPGMVQADPLIIDETALANDRLTPGIYPSAPMPEGFSVPSEPSHPPVEIDWSVGLKGSYTASSAGNAFVTTLKPAFTATHQGVRTDLVLDGSAELARAPDGSFVVDALSLKLDGTTMLGSDTTVSGTAGLRLTQDLPGLPGANPLVSVPPQVLTGTLGGGLDRQFGRFNVGLKGNLERTLYGPTTRRDTGLTDNGQQNVWEGDGTLRLGFAATPIIEVFGEAGLGRDWFDQRGADATSRSLRAGIAGQWNGIWSASASFGVGQHDFDNAGLTDITTQLYDASITYSPDSTVSLTAALATAITPTGADTGGTAKVAHTASADASYTINSWLRLRASADWGHARIEGSGETETSHGLGAGADYRFNSRATLSADYGYVHRDNSLSGTFDSHTVSLGLTVRR
ncbi:outer membrane beta-barrel protein [Devosia sediminis]|uniref:Outer membrane beta-barrel protein n=1 Tax=Devosia sediminis TaxID=2798801 RepID=A0A934J2N3_9HYPH|nr:outer membrane beta-barrel protein [Devosia sediminis]MBJ3786650.1 outer membrane beta-barrel protein [Devosia sediminis]